MGPTPSSFKDRLWVIQSFWSICGDTCFLLLWLWSIMPIVYLQSVLLYLKTLLLTLIKNQIFKSLSLHISFYHLFLLCPLDYNNLDNLARVCEAVMRPTGNRLKEVPGMCSTYQFSVHIDSLVEKALASKNNCCQFKTLWSRKSHNNLLRPHHVLETKGTSHPFVIFV